VSFTLRLVPTFVEMPCLGETSAPVSSRTVDTSLSQGRCSRGLLRGFRNLGSRLSVSFLNFRECYYCIRCPMLDLNFLEHLIEAISAKAKVLYLITAWGDEPIFLNFSIARITGGGATGKTICWYMEDIPFIHLSPSRPRLIRCHFDRL